MRFPTRQTETTNYTSDVVGSRKSFNKKILSVSLALAMNARPVFAELPIPTANFVHAGDASYLVNGADAFINQNTEKAILNWQSFNVGSANSVTFNQPGSSSIALNRIFQNDPSRILGTINANGQVYLYNQNGFIFGKGMRFNANNIVATTLDIDNDLFLESSAFNAIEDQQPAFFDTTGDNQGVITIEDDANITAETIFMFAPEIVNEGNLTSNDGQTILAAAKDKVYLAASDKDASLRGLLVEVETGGTVTNAGNINADRGNITLIGYAVNQNGRVRATTSVDKNGSIRLLARDGATVFENSDTAFNARKDSIGVDERPTASYLAQATNAGQVTLGSGSVTEIAVDSDTVTKVPDAQEQLPSKVEIVGKEVWLKDDSVIRAPAAEVVITATDSPDNPMLSSSRNDSYIYMDEGSVIDVSGSDAAILPMERNSVEVEVRSNELADSPLQRDGVLQGETVYVDLRKGTDIVDYSGAVAVAEKTVAERLASGGQVDIRSEGDFVQRDGSLIDISGGKVTYADGFIKETRLVSDGQIVNISDADKYAQYDAILGVNTKTHDRWGETETFFSNVTAANGKFVSSFVEGKSAGTVNIDSAASLLAKDGIRAETVIGPYQNNVDMLAEQGRVNINLKKFTDSTQSVEFTADRMVAEITDAIAGVPDQVTLLRERLDGDLVLPDNYMKRNGIGELTISSNGEINISDTATVTADAGSDLLITGTSVDVQGDIVIHGGDVSLAATPLPGILRADVDVADGVIIDTSGLWVNNTEFVGGPSSGYPAIVDGGDIEISAQGDVSIGEGSLLSASGGALLGTDYAITAGEGGDISLIARNVDGAGLDIEGELQSYSLTSGGTLHLEAADVLVTNDSSVTAAPNQLLLSEQDFTTGGFSRYEIVANAGNMVIDAVLRPVMKNYGFDNSVATAQGFSSGLLLAPSGTDMSGLVTTRTLAGSERKAVDLEFSLDQVETDIANNLVITDRSRIEVDPGADIVFDSDTRIHMAGELVARAADVSYTINAPSIPTGFVDNQAIWLADGSLIDVSSTAVYELNEQGLQIGEVFDAGNVKLTANRGYVVIDDQAVVDVSAKTEQLDVLVKNDAGGPRYRKLDVAPKAGSVEITAAEGIIIDGQLKAQAATEAGTQGGKLSIALDTNIRNVTVDANNLLTGLGLEKFDFDGRDIVVVDAMGKRLSDDASFGDSIDTDLHGLAYLDVADAEASGFDSIKLKTDHVAVSGVTSASEIRFESDVDLSVDNSVVLSAPVINSDGHDVLIDAAYVALGSDSRSRRSVPTTPVPGLNDFTVDAALVDIVGDAEITGTQRVNIDASDDIRFIGAQTVQAIDRLDGSLTTASDISLTAGQIYPASYSNVDINIVDNPDGVVNINDNGNSSPVLSALGNLRINAPVINQGGVIKAPLGNIELNATEKVILAPESVTSVSAEGLSIPFGGTINAGGSWIYTIQNPLNVELADKSVVINAPEVDMQPGSVVDISGGGDVFAYEFVSGPTGSKDVLLPENADGAFAILPASDSKYAPYDYMISGDLDGVGNQVYLEEGAGLAAGYYAILPARYALVDGAKLVTPLKDISAIFPDQNYSRIDGVEILAGKYAVANTDIVDSTYSAFLVEDGGIARTRSEYIQTSANSFFTTNRPLDAGALIVQTIESLTLASTINGTHAPGTRGSRVDILADNIEVIADGSSVQTAGYIQLTESNLNNLEVDSLMLGGRRRIGDGETDVAVQSGDVMIRDSAQLALPEIFLVAKDNIELGTSSRMEGTGQVTSERSDTFILDNNASIIGVTVNALPTIKRTGTAEGALIDLKSGSTLAADSSIFLSSINDVNLDGTLELVNGNLSIGAKEINFGAAPADATGLNLSAQLINTLVLDQLEVNSVQSMTFYDDLALDFSNLTMSAPGINARSATGSDIVFNASGTVVLRQNGEAATADGQGDGVLDIIAENIILDGSDEDFIFDGFSQINMTASESVSGSVSDTDNRFGFDSADLVIDTPVVTGGSGSVLALQSAGSVTMTNTSGISADASRIYDLGAELNVSADKVLVDTSIIMPSGLVDVSATGTDADDHVTLGSEAFIDVSGRTFDFVDGTQAGSSGGEIRLSSASADVIYLPGSMIDISSSDIAGDAGTLSITAPNGTASISGDLVSRSADGFRGGNLGVDVYQIDDLDAFLQQVQSSGFGHSQRYRVRNSDVDISALAGDETNIRASEIVLVADNGSITISGKLDASGQDAGRIALYASGDIDVAGAMLDAFATGDNLRKGGEIILATTGGGLSVDGATAMDVSGASYGTAVDAGKVTLRAPRTAGNTEVAVSLFDAEVTGAERIDIEGVAYYSDAVIGSAQQGIYSSDAADWLANQTAITNRLSLAADDRVHVLAGVDISNTGDITITDEIDFYQWQLDSADVIDEGGLTIRSANNLNINASISDAVNYETLYDLGFGFSADASVIKEGESWNYQLVSGADLTSAYVLATQSDNIKSTGNIRLASDVIVRTGKGDIKLASGGDLILDDQTSVIYTVGEGNGTGYYDPATIAFTLLPDGPQFPDQGGDIVIDVAEDIVAAVSDQYFTDWLQRVGGQISSTGTGDEIPGMWAVVLDDFEQGIATMGGGDIIVNAGGDVSNLSLSTPTTGQLASIEPEEVVVRGGGDISLSAGGDIQSVRVYVDSVDGDGKARIRARRDVVADGNGLNTLVALGNASVDIEAGGDIAVDGIGNITVLPLSTLQTDNFIKLQEGTNTPYFFTYGEDSSAELLSYYGDIVLDNNLEAIKTTTSNRLNSSPVLPWSFYPGVLAVTTLDGDIEINNQFTLFPDTDGGLYLASGGNIVSREQRLTRSQVFVSVSDVAIAALPSLYEPTNNLDNTLVRLGPGTNDPSLLHDFSGPLHIDDNEPLRITANGDIIANGELKIRSPKAAQVVAGGDIVDFGIEIQNLRDTDKSIVMAGGDIRYNLPDTGSIIVSEGISVTGPGSVTVLAGGDIDLGISKGIRSRGNVENFTLPEKGADIAVFAGIENAGLGAELDTSRFIATYLQGEQSAESSLIDIDVTGYQRQLIEYVLSDNYGGELAQPVSAITGETYSDASEAIAAFMSLDDSQQLAAALSSFTASGVSEQRKLIIDIFTTELNLAAENAAKTGEDSEYARGFLAIGQLFEAPVSNATVLNSLAALAESSRGDINLPFSRIQSTAGGDINVFAPNGDMTVGFTAEVTNRSEESGSLGIVISSTGDLSAMTEGDINVNLSRVQALDGGDISLWSSNGDIDAGRGAKTALTVPPPLTVVNKETGQIEIIFPASVSGSGINAGVSTKGLAPGKVTLAAPGGVVNASDAGIGSAGDLVVAATKVLGGDNINAGGASVGVPTQANVTAGLGNLSNTTDNAVNSASQSASAAAAESANSDVGVALVTVELLAPEDDEDL